MMDSVNDENDHEYYSTLVSDEGLVRVRLSKNGRYFFIMPEPENGYRKFLEDIDGLANTFSLLSDKDTLKILFFMYQRIHKKISSQLIAESVGISVEKVEKVMEQLGELNLADCNEVEIVNGEVKAYSLHREGTILPLLTFVRELNVKKVFDFGYVFKREKPIF